MINMQTLNLDLDDETFLALAKEAHRLNVTFNSLVNMIIADEVILKLQEENKELDFVNDTLNDIIDEMLPKAMENNRNDKTNSKSRSKSQERSRCSSRNNRSSNKASTRKR